jgi:predicted Zn-dependent protease
MDPFGSPRLCCRASLASTILQALDRLHANPIDPDGLFVRGAWHLLRRRTVRAVEDLERLVVCAPEYPGALHLLAHAYDVAGDEGRARHLRALAEANA